ncbi:hypothetical protein [Phreatobacter stygius]|uniref:hypothetical protein n=1 Tax=Phreatobacter stygius TaxID=1940610 RepID=UPI001476F8DC|nr:hypothetical protein [Phreatobacter stygius]
MLIAVIAHLLRERDPRRAAARALRADRAAVPVDELGRAGILRTLAGSFTLPFNR